MLEDLKSNKLYRKQLFLPINASNKKKGSLIYLLSPNIEEAARIMASSYFKNPNLFNAYYLEKDINLIITENMVYNEERNPYDPSITLSKYTRCTITDSDEMEERTGKKLHGGTGILFLEPYTNSYVGYLIVNGSTLVNAYSISATLDKELMAFAIDILKCNICHKDMPNKYKKILKSEYDFKFAGSSSTGIAQNAITLEGEGLLEISTPALLTEGMTRINMELAMWKAQAKITEMILKNWDNTNWMRTQYKSMKAKLNRIPLPGFADKIEDTIESLRDYYANQKETIKFMTEMAAFELRDEYDLEDITKEYTKWVRSTRSSKAFKLKLIREVKDSYKETIKLYKNNLKRYEAQSTVEKRVENGMALVGKTFSIFSFLSGGPLGVLKDVVMKAILPKSQKKNVLSVAEVEAKIEAYERVVQELEELEGEIQKESTNEYMAMAGMNPVMGIGSGPITKNITSDDRVFSGEDDEDETLQESLLETPLTAEQRKNLKDSDYGLPAKRAYPMPDKAHVKAAIRMFNHVDKQDEKVLASAITRKIKEFDMEDEVTVSKKNRYYEYCPSSIREGVELRPLRTEAVLQENTFIRDRDSITYFESALSEDASYNKALRRILFSERLRNQKDISLQYDAIKQACPFIKYTYYDISRYNKLNMFVDMTYYIESFIKNNYLKLDRSINIFFELINRFLKDERFKNAGYNKRTVFVPITGWKVEPKTDIWDYKYNTNPISIIYRLIFSGSIERLREAWGDIDFVFIGKNGYFKFNANTMDKKFIPLFRNNVEKLLSNSFIDDSDEPNSSVRGIVTDIISRIERPDDVTDTNIKVNNLLGDDEDLTPEELVERIDASDVSSEEDVEERGTDAELEAIRMQQEKELVKRVKDVAERSADVDDAYNKLNNDEDFKQILQDLKMSSPNTVDYSVTRVSRINQLKNSFTSKKLKSEKNLTIGDIVLSDKYCANPIPTSSVPIDSTNEEWQHLTGTNFADAYSVDQDIYRILYHFSECKVPVAVRDVKVENTSTSEDTINTWTVACEDINGKRFTLKFDVPIVVNKRFMRLRGNDKVMGTQLMNLPIIKTGLNTVQITTNYNKIFISPYGNNTGKSFVTSDRLIKALKKYNGKNITYVVGDNSKICNRYVLPIDYIDLAGNYMSIKIRNNANITYEFLFNQDIIHDTYKDFIKKDKLLIGIHTDTKGKRNPIYADTTTPISSQISFMLCSLDREFNDIYNATSVSNKYTFSLARIMSSDIPVAVLIGYAIGLIPMLDRANITYTIEDKRPRYDKSSQDILIFKDAYVLYDLTYDSSLLLNGLKGCDLSNYSIKEVNSANMWLDFLDNYGGRIKSDGLDAFYDLLFDPITKNVCVQYDLPNNYVDGLLYANMLLSDNKYNKHTDIRGNRYRNNEIIAAYTYKALATSYSAYRRALKIGREAIMTIKQSAVIDLILLDNTESDYSTLSPLLEFESANATSFKGLSGMNSDRAYGLDKRGFDASMLNVLAMSTGFSANSGVNRQSTIDPAIDTSRGYIQANPKDLNITNTFCMTEALTPYGATSDDPFRTAMTFVQTSKHGMRTSVSDPSLVSTGADEALVYLTSDTFSFKAKGKGKIKEKTDEYMVIEYDKPNEVNNKKTEVIDLREHMMKNSDGGFYQSLKLDTDYKVGDIVRKDDVVACDRLSYNSTVGITDNYAYNIGTFCKFAILMSDEGYEDSCRSTHWLAKALSSTVVIEQQYSFSKDTNITYIAKKGQQVQEGESILTFQNVFDDEDANILLRALKDEGGAELVEEIGRISLKSKVTGVVKDVIVRRCVDTEECSQSLQKIIKDYNKSVKDINTILSKYDEDKAKTADPTYKLPAEGKLKDTEDGVMITIYIAYQDDFSVSDKVVNYSALKGVSSKELIPEGKEAFSTYRPDEKIHYIQTEIGDMKRMVGSVYKIGALNKVLVELHRHMCDIMGIKWKYFDEYEI